jgi:hypothetical protein
MAIARSGAPVPPPIFIGSAMICAPVTGSRIERVEVLERGNVLGVERPMRFEERRLPVVDARGVDADRADRSIGDDPLRGIGMQTGKVEFRDRLLSSFRRAEIPLRVGPSSREAGAEEQDRILADLPVLALEALQIVDGHLIIRVSFGRVDHIDDQRRPNQTLERNLVDRLMSLREVHRGVDVRPAVFGGEEAVRRVVVPLVG